VTLALLSAQHKSKVINPRRRPIGHTWEGCKHNWCISIAGLYDESCPHRNHHRNHHAVLSREPCSTAQSSLYDEPYCPHSARTTSAKYSTLQESQGLYDEPYENKSYHIHASTLPPLTSCSRLCLATAISVRRLSCSWCISDTCFCSRAHSS